MKRTCRFRGDSVLDEAGELLLVSVFILLHQVAHVFGHVDAHDVLAVDLSIELLALCVITGEALGAAGAGQRKEVNSKVHCISQPHETSRHIVDNDHAALKPISYYAQQQFPKHSTEQAFTLFSSPRTDFKLLSHESSTQEL